MTKEDRDVELFEKAEMIESWEKAEALRSVGPTVPPGTSPSPISPGQNPTSHSPVTKSTSSSTIPVRATDHDSRLSPRRAPTATTGIPSEAHPPPLPQKPAPTRARVKFRDITISDDENDQSYMHVDDEDEDANSDEHGDDGGDYNEDEDEEEEEEEARSLAPEIGESSLITPIHLQYRRYERNPEELYPPEHHQHLKLEYPSTWCTFLTIDKTQGTILPISDLSYS
jgi:hypothetical protein